MSGGLLLLVLAVAVPMSLRQRPTPMPTGSATPTASLSHQPANGGTYTEGVLEAPTSLIPFLAQNQTDRDLARILFEGLTRVDGTGKAQPALASDWTVSADGRSYTFTLRPGAKWHDGAPVTGQDVLFTVRLVQSPDFPGDPALARFWRGVSVEAVSEQRVTFTLLEPFAPFPTYADLPLLPRHLLGGVLPGDLADERFAHDPIGTGPFRWAGSDAGDATTTLRAFDGYWGGRPFLDQVVLRTYPDATALTDALRSGAIQGTAAIPAEQALRPGALPPSAVVYAPDLASYTALFFNLRDPLFGSADVRRALALGIDRQHIVDGPLGGFALVGSGPIPATSWAYRPAAAPHDPAEARRLLDAAGWSETDSAGIRVKGGTRLSFPLLVNNEDPQRLAAASEMARQLRAIGVEAVVQQAASPAVSQALASRQFSAAIFGWRAANGDPDPSQLWSSGGADDGMNFCGLRDPAIDAILEQARTSADLEVRRDLYRQFQDLFDEQSPAVVLYYPRYYFVAARAVHGIEPAPVIDPSDRFDGLDHWFLETREPATPVPPASESGGG